MHILMHTPYRLRQTCNDLRRLQRQLTPSIIENRRLRSGLADHVRPPRPAMLGGLQGEVNESDGDSVVST